MNAPRFLACSGLALAACAAMSAQDPADHTRTEVLLVADASAAKLQPRGTSAATATGAFVVNPEKRTLTYDLTYHGLENGPPQSVAIHNFAAGGNGDRIHLLCGQGGRACPMSPSGTISGAVEGAAGAPPIDQARLVEYATGRMYLEIVGGDGRPEIRGQLEPNNSMVHPRSFVARLAPAAQGGAGSGTAVLSEVRFADGRTNVFYRVTVAGTSGAPQGVGLTGVPAAEASLLRPSFTTQGALPQGRAIASKSAATGGTFTGQYEVAPGNTTAPLASRMLSAADRSVAISVRTSRFPAGELVGIFREIH